MRQKWSSLRTKWILMDELATRKPSPVRQYRALLILLAIMLLAVPLLIYKTISYTRTSVLDEIVISSAHTLRLVVENLHGELARYQAMPHLLSAGPIFRKLWDDKQTKEDTERINLFLEYTRNITGALDIYVMDPKGDVVASSSWQEEPFLGKNFAFHPHFQDSMQGLFGRYFSLDSTTNARSYYFSYPLREGAKILGVMVCKIQVGHLEQAWTTRRDEIIVTDRNGVVFLSSNKNWLFKSLAPLSTGTKKSIRANRQYSSTTIDPLPIDNKKRIGEYYRTVDIKSGTDHTRYLQLSRNMQLVGWEVHILAPTGKIKAQIWRNTMAASVLLFGFFAAGALFLERIRRSRERIELQSKARAELELRVQHRTFELQQAQSELIQAGKLAALGKMSAGLSHELNQPLAAIRSYSDNASTLLTRGHLDPAKTNLKNIGELTDRMARIIKHLRTYASKDKIEAGPTNLVSAVREALGLLAHRLDKEKVEIIDQLPDHEVIVHGGSVRLQQVFVNILGNAFDAVATSQQKQVIISLEEQAKMFVVEICDTGPGLTQTELDHVFDPFYSTKEVGEGVGLGLSISYGIITQFGGRIEIINCPRGGAAVKISLLKKVTANV